MEKEMEIMEKNGFTVCEDCGRLVSLDEAIADGDEYYCKDCRVMAFDGCVYERDEVFENDGEFYPYDDYTTCHECGRVIHLDDACWSNAEGEYYCHDCVTYCEHCEEYFLNSDTEEVHVGDHTEYWCYRCRSNGAFRCNECGELFEDDEICYVGDDCICQGCYDENCHYCNECENDVYNYDWDYDEECCCDCASKHGLIAKYHSNPNRFGSGNSRPYGVFMGKWNHLGVELEVEPAKSDADSKEMTEELLSMVDGEHSEIYFERDSSLNSGGFEIITQPHTWEAFNEMPWKEMLEKLREKGFRSHDGGNCGLHVHVSRDVFGDDRDHQDRNIAKIYALFDREWDSLLRLSRRAEDRLGYCAKVCVDSHDVTSTYENLIEYASERRGGHGVAINNCNTNTLEIRLGRGTLKYESFMAWVDIVHCIAFNARHVNNILDIREWLRGARPETLGYIREKNVFPELFRDDPHEGVMAITESERIRIQG